MCRSSPATLPRTWNEQNPALCDCRNSKCGKIGDPEPPFGRKGSGRKPPWRDQGAQWAKIDDHLEIMDTPGLLWPKFQDEKTGAVVALIGSVKLDIP